MLIIFYFLLFVFKFLAILQKQYDKFLYSHHPESLLIFCYLSFLNPSLFPDKSSWPMGQRQHPPGSHFLELRIQDAGRASFSFVGGLGGYFSRDTDLSHPPT